MPLTEIALLFLLPLFVVGCSNPPPPPVIPVDLDGKQKTFRLNDTYIHNENCELNTSENKVSDMICEVQISDSEDMVIHTTKGGIIEYMRLIVSHKSDRQFEQIVELILSSSKLTLEELNFHLDGYYESHIPWYISISVHDDYRRGRFKGNKSLWVSVALPDKVDEYTYDRPKADTRFSRPGINNLEVGEKLVNPQLPGYTCEYIALIRKHNCEGETELGKFSYELVDGIIIYMKQRLAQELTTPELHRLMELYGGAKRFKPSANQFDKDTYFTETESGDVVVIDNGYFGSVSIISGNTWNSQGTLEYHQKGDV